MKNILVFLSLCLTFNSISAIEVFNPQLNQQQTTKPSDIYPASQLQGSVQQQSDQLNTIDIVPDQNHNETTNNKNEIYSNLLGGSYQEQQSQTDPINNQLIHPRFRSMLQNYDQSSLSETTVTDSDSDISSDSHNNNHNTQQVIENAIEDGNAPTSQPLSFAEYYFQQQLKAFFGHYHEKFSSRTHSNIKTGL